MRRASVGQPALPFDDPWRNRGLFADHFLKTRLAQLPGWSADAGLQQAFEALRALYRSRAVKFGDHTNEAQTEDDFIKPVLNVLWGEAAPGDCFQVQVSIPGIGVNRRQPDYALFRNAADRSAADALAGTLDYWRDVPCLADAKRWTASLDKERGDENPSAQIANYLYRSRVRWGILTNGRVWRLYEQDKSRAGGIYFEVDLADLLERGSVELFRWFWCFFRRAAHLPDSSGKTFLDQVFDGSVEYAATVGNKLKESVYDALRLLMTGFLEHADNRLDPSAPATVALVHEQALIVLYRLLFLLYAEDRRLLPRDNEHYAEYSLYRRQTEVNQRLRRGQSYIPRMHGLWDSLTNLFQLIDEGYPEGQIPEYNGASSAPASTRRSPPRRNPARRAGSSATTASRR